MPTKKERKENRLNEKWKGYQYLITYQKSNWTLTTDTRYADKYIDMLRDIASNIQKNKLILVSIVLVNTYE